MMKISAQIAVMGGLTAETMAAVPTERFVEALR